MLRKKLRIASMRDILHLGDGRKGMCTMENKAMIEIFAENLGFAGYEAGKRSPDVEMIAKLSKELYVSVDELLGRYDYGTPNLIRDAKAEYFVEPKYSVQDYFDLPNCTDYELIEGNLVKKNAPGDRHQIIVGQIYMEFYQFFKTHCKKCEVIPAPFCGVLSMQNAVVVQPDLSVICDRTKIQDGVCMGPPDLVVEILSPGNKKYDCLEKLGIYSKYDVREYWIIDPEQENIMMYDRGKAFQGKDGFAGDQRSDFKPGKTAGRA